MPRPPRICSCGRVVAYGATCICRHQRNAERERARPSARQRGYTGKWEREAKAFPTCACGRPATCVDHIIAHKKDPKLFWNRNNWAALCGLCHGRKSVRQDGGFGNKVKS